MTVYSNSDKRKHVMKIKATINTKVSFTINRHIITGVLAQLMESI